MSLNKIITGLLIGGSLVFSSCDQNEVYNEKTSVEQVVADDFTEEDTFTATGRKKKNYEYFVYQGNLDLPQTIEDKLEISNSFNILDREDLYKNTDWDNVKVIGGKTYIIAKKKELSKRFNEMKKVNKVNKKNKSQEELFVPKSYKELSTLNNNEQEKVARWLVKKYPQGNINLPKPEVDPTYDYGFIEITGYYTADCNDFEQWIGEEQSHGRHKQPCNMYRKDNFCSAVLMQGSGICKCNGETKHYTHYDFGENFLKKRWGRGELKDPLIVPRRCEGGEVVDSDFLGHSKSNTSLSTKRTIAVNPKYIPYGSLVYIEFPRSNRSEDEIGKQYSGWYVAEDTGGTFSWLPKIDIYIGLGDSAKKEAYAITRPFPDCVDKGYCSAGKTIGKAKNGPQVWVVPPENVKEYLGQ